MSKSWAKVCSFLDLMDVQDLNSSLSLSPKSSSFSSNSTFNLHPLSIGAERWQVAEKTTQQILSIIQPTSDSEKRRKEIIEYIQALIEDSFGIKVFPFGSVPLKTYLPHGDVDLTALSHCDLAADICNLLQDEEKNNTSTQVRNVLYVPAQVRVVKCTVSDIAVDISFNQTAGLSALYFLEQVDQFIGKDHLFKRSVILIKAWCYYESRLLGGFHGLISTYALETLVLHVINHFHSSLHCPLAVLYKFLEYYSTFNWERYCIGINGLVLVSSLPDIAVLPPQDSDEALLTDGFLSSTRETFSSFTGVLRTERPAFPVKFLNILDPLRDDNNLGRSVSKSSFYRIRSALSYGTQKLGDVLMLPPEKIGEGLEKFFVNTLERSGRGRPADVLNPVPPYGAANCETASVNRDTDNLLAGIQYGLWFHDGMIYPLQPSRPAPPQVWTNGWVEMAHNVHFENHMYYNVDESPPSSANSPRGLQLNIAASVEVKGKSKGTEPYIPHLDTFLQDGVDMEENEREWDGGKDVGRVDSWTCMHNKEATFVDEGIGSCVFQFTVEEFPVLPGSKPIPVKVSQSGPSVSVYELVNESASSESLEFGSLKHSSPSVSVYEQVNESAASDSLEFGSLKHSSPRSLSFSEPGNQISIAVEEDQESSKSEEKLVIPVQPLELTDEKEFPPLVRPPQAKPEIRINKKEFPPLGAASKSEKRNRWKRNPKENKREEWMGTSTSI